MNFIYFRKNIILTWGGKKAPKEIPKRKEENNISRIMRGGKEGRSIQFQPEKEEKRCRDT